MSQMAVYLRGGQLHQQGQKCQRKSGKIEREQTKQIDNHNKIRLTGQNLSLPLSSVQTG